MKRNFKIIISFLLFALVLASCGYKVDQFTTHNFWDTTHNFWENDPYLVTRLKKNTDIVKVWRDAITLEMNDSIKCARYNEAVRWGEKLKSLEAIKCK